MYMLLNRDNRNVSPMFDYYSHLIKIEKQRFFEFIQPLVKKSRENNIELNTFRMSELVENQASSITRISSCRPPQVRVIENFIIIWLNSHNTELDENSLDQLRQIINSIKIFSNTEQCIECLSQIQDEKLFLIISNSFNHKFLSLIEQMPQFHAIYLLSDKKINYSEYKKIKGIYNTINLICTELKQDIPQCQRDLTPISIVTLGSMNDLDQSFMYSQLVKETLLDMNYNKNELIDFCRVQYADNRYALDIINEFQRDYNQPSPIWWYTRDCFTYSMLNKALRTQDTEIIIKMGFFYSRSS